MSMLTLALRAIETFHPEYKSFLDFVINHEDKVADVGAVVTAAVKEGGSAIAAAEAAAPDLVAAIKKLVHVQPGVAASPAAAEAKLNLMTENFTRELYQLGRMTPEEEAKWMADATPAFLSDSRLGSG